jgi:hypothetical protein
MMSGSGILKIALSVVMFPTIFQAAFIAFAWGNGDELWLTLSKRLFLILPVCAIVLGCWLSMACLFTVPFRQNRREFVTAIFVTWWELGKAIVSFWGGILKMFFSFTVALLGLLRFLLFGVWAIVQDILLIPFTLMRRTMRSVLTSPIPWIAVTLTLAWCALETMIFTYVTTPLVMDTMSNITGESLSEATVRIPLATFLFFVVLGSYAVLWCPGSTSIHRTSSWASSGRSRSRVLPGSAFAVCPGFCSPPMARRRS